MCERKTSSICDESGLGFWRLLKPKPMCISHHFPTIVLIVFSCVQCCFLHPRYGHTCKVGDKHAVVGVAYLWDGVVSQSEKVIRLLHVQLPLVRGELHEPDGVRGLDELEPGGYTCERGILQLRGIHLSLPPLPGDHECETVHSRVGVLLLGQIRSSLAGMVYFWDVRIRRVHRLLREHKPRPRQSRVQLGRQYLTPPKVERDCNLE